MNGWIRIIENNLFSHLHFDISSYWYQLWNTQVGHFRYRLDESENTFILWTLRSFTFLLYCRLRIFILMLCWTKSRDKRAEWPFILVHRVLKHSFFVAAYKQHPCVINSIALFVPYLSEFIAEINLNCGHESAYIPAGNMASCLLHRQP